MSGKTEVAALAITLIALLAAATDLCRGRIYNWLTFGGAALGVAYWACTEGGAGFAQTLGGMGLGLLLYGWMFWLGYLGGGDLKLLMALGAWGGPAFTADVAFLSVLVGGGMAVVLLVWHGQAAAFLRKMKCFLLSVFVKELELELPEVNRKLTLPYGVPMACSAIWVLFANPMVLWSLRLW